MIFQHTRQASGRKAKLKSAGFLLPLKYNKPGFRVFHSTQWAYQKIGARTIFGPPEYLVRRVAYFLPIRVHNARHRAATRNNWIRFGRT